MQAQHVIARSGMTKQSDIMRLIHFVRNDIHYSYLKLSTGFDTADLMAW